MSTTERNRQPLMHTLLVILLVFISLSLGCDLVEFATCDTLQKACVATALGNKDIICDCYDSWASCSREAQCLEEVGQATCQIFQLTCPTLDCNGADPTTETTEETSTTIIDPDCNMTAYGICNAQETACGLNAIGDPEATCLCRQNWVTCAKEAQCLGEVGQALCQTFQQTCPAIDCDVNSSTSTTTTSGGSSGSSSSSSSSSSGILSSSAAKSQISFGYLVCIFSLCTFNEWFE